RGSNGLQHLGPHDIVTCRWHVVTMRYNVFTVAAATFGMASPIREAAAGAQHPTTQRLARARTPLARDQHGFLRDVLSGIFITQQRRGEAANAACMFLELLLEVVHVQCAVLETAATRYLSRKVVVVAGTC